MKNNNITLNVLSDISRRVKDGTLKDSKKRALVVITGAKSDILSRIDELNVLKSDGVTFDLAFSFMAENIVKRDRIIKRLSPKNVFTEEDIFKLNKIKDNYDFLISPNITINTLSKVTSGVIDSFISSIIWTFLYQGKRVYLDYDCIKNYMGDSCKNIFITGMLEERFELLSKMGVIEIEKGSYLGEIKKFEETLESEEEKKQVKDVESFVYETDLKESEDREVGEKKIYTAIDMDRLEKTSLVLYKGDILTPLAKDRARALNIEIITK